MRWDFSSWYWGPLCIRSQGQSSAQIKSNIPFGAFTEISPKGFTLGVKAENDFNLTLYGPGLAPRLKKYTSQLERPICNPGGQCYNNKILLFWWNSHRRIKLNLRSNPIFSPSFIFLFFSFYFLFVELLCLFVNDGRSLWVFYLGYGRCWSVSWKWCVKCGSSFISAFSFISSNAYSYKS